MEAIDRELIDRVVATNSKLKRLYAEHLRLEKELDLFERRTFLTAQEEVLVKKLKQKKLLGVDRIMEILQGHREEVTVQ